MAADPVTVTLEIAAAPEDVFPYFTDSERVMAWQGGDAHCEPIPGGEFTMDIPGNNVVRGQYVEIDPPRRVVFTWGMESGYNGDPSLLAAGTTTVEVTLDAISTGTRLTICHSKLPDEEHAERHKNGWIHYMNRLATLAEGKPLPSDDWRT